MKAEVKPWSALRSSSNTRNHREEKPYKQFMVFPSRSFSRDIFKNKHMREMSLATFLVFCCVSHVTIYQNSVPVFI
jgi:hypothetical protein